MTLLRPLERTWSVGSILAVASCLCACQPQVSATPEPTTQALSSAKQDTSTTSATDTPSSEREELPTSDDEPVDDLVGELTITKGQQPVLAGHLLQTEEMETRFGSDWRGLEGSRFWAKGQLRVHRCEPMAQCLVGGSIPLIEDITAIDLCLGCGFYPEGVVPVECPVSDDEAASCKEICRTRSRSCDEGAKDDRGRKRRCGGQRAGCFSDCDRVGVPCH